MLKTQKAKKSKAMKRVFLRSLGAHCLIFAGVAITLDMLGRGTMRQPMSKKKVHSVASESPGQDGFIRSEIGSPQRFVEI